MNLKVVVAYFDYISFAILSTLIEHFHDWRMVHQPKISVCPRLVESSEQMLCHYPLNSFHILNLHRTRLFVIGLSMIVCSYDLGYSKH